MRQYAVPCIISLLVGALYNIVDQIFIANAAYLGSYGNAANTVVFPMTVLALGKAALSTVLSLMREIVFGVFLSLLLPLFLGMDGVLFPSRRPIF